MVFPIISMVDLSIVFCDTLPGRLIIRDMGWDERVMTPWLHHVSPRYVRWTLRAMSWWCPRPGHDSVNRWGELITPISPWFLLVIYRTSIHGVNLNQFITMCDFLRAMSWPWHAVTHWQPRIYLSIDPSGYLAIYIWRCPKSWGYPVLSLDGFCSGKSIYKWMRTGGSPMENPHIPG